MNFIIFLEQILQLLKKSIFLGGDRLIIYFFKMLKIFETYHSNTHLERRHHSEIHEINILPSHVHGERIHYSEVME